MSGPANCRPHHLEFYNFKKRYDSYMKQETDDAARENRKPVFMSKSKFRNNQIEAQQRNFQKYLAKQEAKELNNKDFEARVMSLPSKDMTNDAPDLPLMSDSEDEEGGEIASPHVPDKNDVPYNKLSREQLYYMSVGKRLLQAIKDKKPFKIAGFSKFRPRMNMAQKNAKKRANRKMRKELEEELQQVQQIL